MSMKVLLSAARSGGRGSVLSVELFNPLEWMSDGIRFPTLRTEEDVWGGTIATHRRTDMF